MSRQGKRMGKMVVGSMCDMSVLRVMTPEEEARRLKDNREAKARHIKLIRKVIFANDWEAVKCYICNWPFDNKTADKLKNLYNRLHRPHLVRRGK